MVKIIIAGDFVPRNRVSNLIDNDRYDEIFDDVVKYTSQADYSIVNLESPIVISDAARPIEKYGPNLKCSPKAINALKYAGFDMVTLANNHIYDYGDIAIHDTIITCKRENVDYIGAGHNIEEASAIFYKTIKGIRFAFINCCESEFSIAKVDSGGANPLNPIKQYYKILEARQHADKVIVIVHGGHEYFDLPSPRMKSTYRFFVDAGADVVVNHHQHCYSGYEIYNDSLIFYGLGNFCFDKIPVTDTSWNYGYMVELNIDLASIDYVILPYNQCGNTPLVKVLPKDVFSDNLTRINECISNDIQLENAVTRYYESVANYEMSILEPYNSRLMKKLYSLNLLPRLIRRKKQKAILNHIQCESHRDKMIFALELNK